MKPEEIQARTISADEISVGPGKVSVGRMVHYVLPQGGAGGQHVGEVRPLIVTQVFEGGVNGQVILDGINDAGHDGHAYTVSQDEHGKLPGTWHWPPRV